VVGKAKFCGFEWLDSLDGVMQAGWPTLPNQRTLEVRHRPNLRNGVQHLSRQDRRGCPHPFAFCAKRWVSPPSHRHRDSIGTNTRLVSWNPTLAKNARVGHPARVGPPAAVVTPINLRNLISVIPSSAPPPIKGASGLTKTSLQIPCLSRGLQVRRHIRNPIWLPIMCSKLHFQIRLTIPQRPVSLFPGAY
jgi:hypothetical protein